MVKRQSLHFKCEIIGDKSPMPVIKRAQTFSNSLISQLKKKTYKMHSFELVKGYWRDMGIFECKIKREWRLSIFLKCGHFLVLISCALSTLWFTIFEAQTFRQRTTSFCHFLCSILLTIWYSIHILQNDQFVEQFKVLTNIIEQSKIAKYFKFKENGICSIFEMVFNSLGRKSEF